jgi:hypothetical protein
MIGSFVEAKSRSVFAGRNSPEWGRWRVLSASYASGVGRKFMKATLIFLVILAACAALFVFAPHHRRRPESFKACTLGEIYGGLFDDFDWMRAPKLGFFVSCALAGIFAAVYPAAMVLMSRWTIQSAAQRGGAMFVLAGLLAIAGAAVNLLAIIVSHMSFGFGVSQSDKDMTAFVWILPGYQVAFGVLSIVVGCSTTCAGWAHRVVSN